MLEAFRLADPGKGMLPRIAQQCFDLLQDFLVTMLPKVEIFSAVEGEFDGQRQSIDLSIMSTVKVMNAHYFKNAPCRSGQKIPQPTGCPDGSVSGAEWSQFYHF